MSNELYNDIIAGMPKSFEISKIQKEKKTNDILNIAISSNGASRA